MNIQLKTKRALVTASTGGIGFAVAKGLAEAGAAVVVNGRSEGSVNAAVARLLAAVPGAGSPPSMAGSLRLLVWGSLLVFIGHLLGKTQPAYN